MRQRRPDLLMSERIAECYPGEIYGNLSEGFSTIDGLMEQIEPWIAERTDLEVLQEIKLAVEGV